MTPVEQLGDDGRWYVQLSAIWHWYLPLCIYRTLFFLNYIHPFLFLILFFNLVSINWTEWSTISACPSLMRVTGVLLKGLTV